MGIKRVVLIGLISCLVAGCRTGSRILPEEKNCQGQMKNDKREGVWVCKNPFDATTIEIVYENGKKNGPLKILDSQGQTHSTSHWEDDLLEGPSTQFKNGKPVSESNFKQDRLHGRTREWDQNGNLILESFYEHAALEGVVRLWHANRKLKNLGTYQKGVLEGPYKEWWDNGQLKCQGFFKSGKKQGPFQCFDRFSKPTVDSSGF